MNAEEKQLLYAISRIVNKESPYRLITGDYYCKYCDSRLDKGHAQDCPLVAVRTFVMEYENKAGGKHA